MDSSVKGRPVRGDGDIEHLDENIEALLEQIARRELKMPTLKPSGIDRCDHAEVSVWAVHRALQAAFFAGRSAAKSSRRGHKVLSD